MRRMGWTIGATAVLLAGVGAWALHQRDAAPHPTPVAVVSAPVAIARPQSAGSSAAPSSPAAPPAIDAARRRPERMLVDRIATHDRRGGDVRMMAAVMATQPRPAGVVPVETAMTAAVARLPVFATAGDPVHVTCVRTGCEVAGLLPAGQTQASMAAAFRDRDLERTMLYRGYSPGPLLVADAGDGRTGFVFYLNNEF